MFDGRINVISRKKIGQIMKRLFNYMNPSLDPDTEKEMNTAILKNIHTIALIGLVFEAAAAIVFIISVGGKIDNTALFSVVGISFSILLCTYSFFHSKYMLKKDAVGRTGFFIFKLIVYIGFTASAILFDYHNYRAGYQMVTFYIINLVMISFVLFTPWFETVLVTCSYLAMFICMYMFDGAAHIQPIDFFVLALVSIATSTVRYHSKINISSHTVRLTEYNTVLENTSRRDGLTGLLNRLALEDDAQKTDGREMTVYMIDINYFKEINDQYGHAAGDEILRRTSEILKRLFPKGRHYRYGGDEFLIMVFQPEAENYSSDTYEFTQEEYGVKVLLSIGNAKGSPADYHGFFDLISRADKALYVVKERTHSVEFGGHGSRKATQ